jgi:hypothetical protein
LPDTFFFSIAYSSFRTVYRIKGVPNPWNMQSISSSVEPLKEPDLAGKPSKDVMVAPLLNLGPTTDSPETIALIRSWLQNCGSQHRGSCWSDGSGLYGGSQEPLLPTRIIDISEQRSRWGHEQVRICCTNGQRGRYMCLSYCWGQADFLRSTSRNIKAHQKGIRLSKLPPVFQDFIQLARAVDIQYVWIDSLCILQDDGGDWFTATGKMASVYQNSYLTVAASLARSPLERCFVPRTQFVAESVECNIVHDFPFLLGPSEAFPLLNRGWAYQERLLSPRVLHLGPTGIFWECSESFRLESSRPPAGRDIIFKDYFLSVCRSIPAGGSDQQKFWRRIVVQYSSLALSKPSDRLPALQGIADAMKRVRGEEYYAGLWSGSFIADMLWFLTNTFVSRPGASAAESEPQHAPSWSWACVNRKITYDSWLYVEDSMVNPRGSQLDLHSEVVAVERATAGPLSAAWAQSWALRLRCRLLRAVVSEWGDCLVYSNEHGRNGIVRDTYPLYYDNDGNVFADKEVWIARLATHPVFMNDAYDYLLMLAAVPNRKKVFKRIGLTHETTQAQLWPEEMSEITII